MLNNIELEIKATKDRLSELIAERDSLEEEITYLSLLSLHYEIYLKNNK